MGCDPDAFAVIDGEFIYATDLPEVHAQFRAAAEDVRRRAGSVDGFLGELCSLDCSACERFLAQALGFETIPRGDVWWPDDVQRMAKSARWPDPAGVAPDQAWAYWSARTFFDLCVQNGLGIWLS